MITMNLTEFQKQILAGIPEVLPQAKAYDAEINHAPIRKDILSLKKCTSLF